MLSLIINIIKLTRPINCIITFSSVFIGGFIISESEINLNLLLLASISASLIAAAGNVINDIYDVEIDKLVHRERPLAANLISVKDGIMYYFFLNFLSLFILSFTKLHLFLIGVLTIITLFLYSKWLKRVFILSNIIVATLTGLTFIFAGVAVGNVDNSLMPALFAFMINLIREIVKDIEDFSGDIKYKINSLPIVIGIDKTKNILQVLTIILILLTIYPFVTSIYKIEYFITVMILVNPILVLSIKMINQNEEKNNFRLVSKLLKVNMVFGLIAIYFGK